MLPYVLNLAYLLALLIASPWLAWAAIRKGKYREGWQAKLLGAIPTVESDQPRIWLHAVSVGEVNLLGTLLEQLRQTHPSHLLVISTTTKPGYELAQKKYAAHPVFYCPLDFTWAVRRAMNRIRPDLLVLAELELWPNLIWTAKRHGAKVAVVNGRLSEHSFRGYRRLRVLLRPLFRAIDLIAVQNTTYANRFRELGATEASLIVTGSLKFDGATTERDNPATRRLVKSANIQPDDAVFLAGSTQHPEEAIALKVFQRLQAAYPELRLILVPRHPERFDEVARLLDGSGCRWIRRSQLEAEGVDKTARVLLVDTVGELGAWWGAADIAFVGGSMGTRGGQNMIEPAAYGAAVCFGPNTRNFRDIVALMREVNAAAVVHDGAELEQFLQRCLDEPDYAAGLGQAARQVVRAQLGATARTIDSISNLLNASEKARAA